MVQRIKGVPTEVGERIAKSSVGPRNRHDLSSASQQVRCLHRLPKRLPCEEGSVEASDTEIDLPPNVETFPQKTSEYH